MGFPPFARFLYPHVAELLGKRFVPQEDVLSGATVIWSGEYILCGLYEGTFWDGAKVSLFGERGSIYVLPEGGGV